MGIKPNPEGLGATEFARMSLEHDRQDYEAAVGFVNMLIPREWIDSSYLHTLGKIAGIRRTYLNEALGDAIKSGVVERSATNAIRASDRFEVSDEQQKFIEQMKGLLRVREETDEFIAYELIRQLEEESIAKAS